MMFSDTKKHKIVSTSTAENVGRVSGFVVDPSTISVIALTVKKSEGGDTLAWADLTAFGVDAVTVSGAADIKQADGDISALLGKDHEVVGKRVLSMRGDDLGKVKDVEFDAATGKVTALLVDKERRDASGLKGVGSYAVVLDVT